MSVGFAKKNLNRNNYIFFSVIREKMAVSVCDWQACMMITVGGGGGGEEGGGEGGEDEINYLYRRIFSSLRARYNVIGSQQPNPSCPLPLIFPPPRTSPLNKNIHHNSSLDSD